MNIKKNIKLAGYTTFHIGGKAEFFVEVKSVKELGEAVDFAKKNKLKIFVLGGGSNVLLPDEGIRRLVLKMDVGGIKIKGDRIYAGAGETWDKVVIKAISNKLWGIENLSLIPGSVGGAVYQNIGAYGAELKDVLESVDVFDIKSKTVKQLSNKDCQFGYRTSVFQKPIGKNYIILGANSKLLKNHTPDLSYPDLAKYFGSDLYHDRDINTISKITLNAVRNAVIKIRKSKLVYPSKNVGTAGSFFKNPTVPTTNYQLLITNYPDLKGQVIKNGLIKLSAGQLIEMVRWKGKRFRNVGVSDKHALVLVSYKGAKAKDMLKLVELIQKSVKKKFGVMLEPEVRIVTND